jgi:hypothetical protein
MQPSKNAMQNLNEKNSQNSATKILQHKLQQSHTKQCNKTKPKKNQNQTKETAQNSETLPLTMRVWVGCFHCLVGAGRGFGFCFQGFSILGVRVFLGGVLEKKKNTKSSNNLFLSLQKHQSFLPAKASIFSISANTQQWKCKGKQRSIKV